MKSLLKFFLHVSIQTFSIIFPIQRAAMKDMEIMVT
jgi:hypothetical protein